MEGCLHLEDVDRSSILGRHPEFQVYRFNTLFQWYCSDTPQATLGIFFFVSIIGENCLHLNFLVPFHVWLLLFRF